jgi:UDP-GlcNAc:undecaprenyl-phosphate/decaprenyl-phosphate GlcNAc-1-phosphate transferase
VGGYLIVLGATVGTTLLLTPLVRRLAIRIGAVVAPDERRVHDRPTPTLGGVAMYFGLLAGLGTATVVPQFDPVFRDNSEPLGILLGATIILLVGALDDLLELSAPAKAAGMVLAGSALSLLGVSMLWFRVPFGEIVSVSPDLAPLVTVLWVLALANAVNFIDGLDGLAAGVVAIAAGAFALYSDHLFELGRLGFNNNSIGPLVAVVALGMCLGFLPFNVHPARIFMGDAGALLLGLLMACWTLLVGGGTHEAATGSTAFFLFPLLIPLVIMGVPVLDLAFAVVRRASRRVSPAVADRNHLHHRLERLGHGQRRSVFILWAWTAILSGLVLAAVYTDQSDALVPAGIAALAVLLYTVLHPEARRSRRRKGAPGPASTPPAPPLEGDDEGEPAALTGAPRVVPTTRE